MDLIFCPQLNFGSLLDEVYFYGGAFAAEAITPGFLLDLRSEVCGLSTMTRHYDGKVSERYERARMIGRANFSPLVGLLANHLSWRVRLAMGRRTQLRAWSPNDAEVHFYADPQVAITPHRDFSDNELLIASVTIDGFAPFEFHGESRTDNPTIWETGPGSLVLLAATGYESRLKCRPVHAIGPPYNGSRISAVYWMSQRVGTMSA